MDPRTTSAMSGGNSGAKDLQFLGLTRWEMGRLTPIIVDPVRKRCIWLGPLNSVEEATRAYHTAAQRYVWLISAEAAAGFYPVSLPRPTMLHLSSESAQRIIDNLNRRRGVHANIVNGGDEISSCSGPSLVMSDSPPLNRGINQDLNFPPS